MKKFLLIIVALVVNLNSALAQEYSKAYFAGGCFWCVEEYFDDQLGVISTISGYSGGRTKNPTYKQVTFEDTGHVETVEVTYDSTRVNYEELMNLHLSNIDLFDDTGQFCDKGKSYRSVIFYQSENEKKIISKQLKKLEEKFKTKIFVLQWKFEKFYKAEAYHQDYYEKNFINYLLYKSGCGREERLREIWR
jgi:peptide-methionine (S)-S-oxide reductase|tara:strand:- start:365 stop:940 length:576 start_codon:yes stop_codon:yes gene_type:complete